MRQNVMYHVLCCMLSDTLDAASANSSGRVNAAAATFDRYGAAHVIGREEKVGVIDHTSVCQQSMHLKHMRWARSDALALRAALEKRRIGGMGPACSKVRARCHASPRV